MQLERAGYVPQTLPLQLHANLWYSLGNLAVGVIPGCLLIDPFNGGMYAIEPTRVSQVMDKVGARCG